MSDKPDRNTTRTQEERARVPERPLPDDAQARRSSEAEKIERDVRDNRGVGAALRQQRQRDEPETEKALERATDKTKRQKGV